MLKTPARWHPIWRHRRLTARRSLTSIELFPSLRNAALFAELVRGSMHEAAAAAAAAVDAAAASSAPP